MSELRTIRLDLIDKCKDSRVVDPAQVQAIVEDMADAGTPLPSPFDVIERGERFEQVFGQHRLAAYEQAGLVEVACRVCQPEEFPHVADIKLHQVKENLFQRSLNALDRAFAINDWKVAFEAKYPTYKHGGRRVPMTEGDQVTKIVTCFTDAARDALGLGQASIYNALKIAQKLNPTLKPVISLTDLAKKEGELRALVEHRYDRQREIVSLILDPDAEQQTVAEAVAFLDHEPVAEKPDAVSLISERFAKLPDARKQAFFELHAEEIELWMASR